MSVPRSVLVVGASAAGLGTAEALRRKGYQGRLTVLGAETHLPYDRPPLSKQVLSGAWEPDRTPLRTQERLDTLDAEFLLGDAAVSLDAAARTVRTAAGRSLGADAIVVATGLRPRTLPGQEELRGVHVLRTLDDAVALRSALADASRVVVVGDGVLGAEIAATARQTGPSVTLVGPQPAPMSGQLGPWPAGLLAELHAEHGVRLVPGTAVAGLTSHRGRVTGVRLPSGEALPADLVVVAIGSAPATEWLAGSGLEVADGVVCDAYCRAAPGVYAAGDVARWHHGTLGMSLRLENRTNAIEQPSAVASVLLGEDRPYTPVPYFWTDQFAAKIQVHGTPTPDAEVTVVEGTEQDRRFVAVFSQAGRTTAVLGWNMPKQTRLHRQALVDASTRRPVPSP
ncbi:FAD-dependent oxidoreductase [Streptomyces sp. NBC_01795]|uniref:NAD(P)/FAD-dependent oxidoreductase n=1 Tax=unclassified Streptomyces TaxID=2593676 RepID=UPI002DD84FCB|nr:MULTISPECIES: FAD-dependent oxidoreductase [unclassified Streptomyces]WSA96036.1 FAD-dependent oxidoreductase [Streptomyces sp. NBC_01795]WSB80451.1 FAD-dependent oxidoreductase [Streptomyces sp. NBC_01775]